jgi:hypothetical protein
MASQGSDRLSLLPQALARYDALRINSLWRVIDMRNGWLAGRSGWRKWAAGLFVSAALLLAPAVAPAVIRAVGDLITGIAPPPGLGNGTVSLYSFSDEVAPNPVGSNLKTSTEVRAGNGPITNPAGTTVKRKITVPHTVDKKTMNFEWGPSLFSLTKQPKPGPSVTVGTKEFFSFLRVNSTSGLFTGTAQVTGPGNDTKGILHAAGLGFDPSKGGPGAGKNDVGAAAGEALDPFGVEQGLAVDLDPEISATLQLDANAVGAVGFFETDSSIFTEDDLGNFVDDGSPMGDTLWQLSLSAENALSGASGVDVQFLLNPMALDEIVFPSDYLSELPGYSASLDNDDLAALIDANIDSAIGSALCFSGGVASLTNYDLFPDDTTYTAVDSDEQFASGVEAGVEAAPLPPASLQALVLVLTLGVSMLLRRVFRPSASM